MKRNSVSLLVLAAVCLTVLGGPVAGSQATGKTVTLRNIAFSPKSVTILRNSTVTFRWRDDGTTHNVRSVGRRRFKTITDRSTGSKTLRFTSRGTYRYECTLHPGMTGRIVVH